MSEVHGKAANILKERGWVQGFSGDAEGRLDVLGAIWHATNKDVDEYRKAVDELGNKLNSKAKRPSHAVIGWNDAEGRTEDEAIEVLEGVAV